MAGKNVIFDSRFRQFGDDLERKIGRALEQEASRLRAEAQSVNKRGYRIEGIVGDVGVTAANQRTFRGKEGIEVAVAWKDFRAIFFEKGTRARRRGKLSKRTRRKTAANAGGVRAIRFMRTALKKVDLVEAVRRELS